MESPTGIKYDTNGNPMYLQADGSWGYVDLVPKSSSPIRFIGDHPWLVAGALGIAYAFGYKSGQTNAVLSIIRTLKSATQQ